MSRRQTHLKALHLALEDRKSFVDAYATNPDDPAATRAAELVTLIKNTINKPPARIKASGFWHDVLYYAVQAAETRIGAFDGAEGLAREVRALRAFTHKAQRIRQSEYHPSIWDQMIEEMHNSPDTQWIHPLLVKPTPTDEQP